MHASLTLFVNPDGNWQLDPVDVPNNFPPIALPSGDPNFITATQVQEYAVVLLRANGVTVPNGMYWQEIGHTVVNDSPHGAFRATWEA